MRLFVAAELPGKLYEALCENSAVLRDKVRGRYVAPDSFHMTLAFLGDVAAERVDDVCAALDEGCELQPPIRVTLGPLGSFGKARRATLWQGLSLGVDEMGGLAGDIRECLVAHGLSYDAAAFVPHVTLMRSADLTDGMLPPVQMATGVIDTVTLFRSHLGGERARYEPLYSVRLVDLPAAVEPEEV